VYVEKFSQWRITLLCPVFLEAALHTLMLVAGTDKAERCEKLLHAPILPGNSVQIATLRQSERALVPDKAAARVMD